jgi:decaprenylphospho-beta-D-erythro-pentofuranosid-2-ulose 2-reductase
MKSNIQKAMVFGATSAIATAYCQILAGRGASFHLVGRKREALQDLASDLGVRGANTVSISVADLCDTQHHEQLVAEGWEQLGSPDLVLLAHGSLGTQIDMQTDWQQQRQLIQTNLVSHLSLLTIVANKFEQQRSGCLAATSSVAGDRGKASNYIYGTTKAALSCYLEGLQNRLGPAGVRVVDIRLGPVDTPMTAGMPKGLLWSDTGRVARALDRKLAHQSGTVYLPFYWRFIMMLVRMMPDALIRRLGS